MGDLITALPILIKKTSLLWLPRLPTDCIFLAHELIVLVALLVLTHQACWGAPGLLTGWDCIPFRISPQPSCGHMCVCVCVFVYSRMPGTRCAGQEIKKTVKEKLLTGSFQLALRTWFAVCTRWVSNLQQSPALATTAS